MVQNKIISKMNGKQSDDNHVTEQHQYTNQKKNPIANNFLNLTFKI